MHYCVPNLHRYHSVSYVYSGLTQAEWFSCGYLGEFPAREGWNLRWYVKRSYGGGDETQNHLTWKGYKKQIRIKFKYMFRHVKVTVYQVFGRYDKTDKRRKFDGLRRTGLVERAWPWNFQMSAIQNFFVNWMRLLVNSFYVIKIIT